ncbi:hypothetical protein SLS56_008556 [Neofusicoccum ribis]|uniref:Mid2 domain-containing protein n=1 Tax=Neofusicoccum ribis TaxID=45134 RepID=A0ABR3SJX0_9PEZI
MSFLPSLLARLFVLFTLHHVKALENTNFFYFPSLSEPIPQVIAGDTLNVSWSSSYAKASKVFPVINMLGLCTKVTPESVSLTPSLASAATEPIVIKDTWDSPCHFQLGITDGYGWFDSGLVQIVNETRDATTWVATGSCTATTTSGSSSTAAVTASSAGTGSDTTGTADVASATTTCEPKPSGPGLGAGVGIGIGISAALAAIPMLLLFCRRRKEGTYEKNPQVEGQPQAWGGYYNNQPGPIHEVSSQTQYNELSAPNSNLIELDSQGQRK